MFHDPDPAHSVPIPACALCDECKPNLILQSSSGERFGASAEYLHRYSGGFPSPNTVKQDQTAAGIVTLTERSAVVRCMLQFMHQTDQPNLTVLTEDTLLELAEAVDKYMIYPAQIAMKATIRSLAPQYPIEVYTYAARHHTQNADLLDHVERYVLEVDYKTNRAMRKLFAQEPLAALALSMYRDNHWKRASAVLEGVRSVAEPTHKIYRHAGGIDRCDAWIRRWESWRRKLEDCDLSEVMNLYETYGLIFKGFDCGYCDRGYKLAAGDIHAACRKLKEQNLRECLRSVFQ